MNTDELIAKLVEMTPAQRSQYADIHADDAILLSVAKYVDNELNEDAARLAARQTGTLTPVNRQVVDSMAGAQPQQMQQPQQPQQPQPQQMAQGLPEESGIGALPVPEMKHMAGGGIVAFAGGGVPTASFGEFLRTQGISPSDFSRMAENAQQTLRGLFSNATMGPQVPAPASAPVTNVPPAPTGNPYAPATPGASYAETKSPLQRLLSGPKGSVMGSLAVPALVAAGGAKLTSAAANTLNAMSDDELETLSNAGGGDDTAFAAAIMREARNTPVTPTPAPPAKKSVATMPTDATRRGDVRFPGGSAATASDPRYAGEKTSPAAPGAGAVAGAKTGVKGAPPRAGASATPVQQVEEDYGTMFNRIRNGMPDARATMPKEIKEMGDLREAQASKELKSEEDAKAGLASLLGKREARIGEREKRLADKSSNDINMSLIDAGLAMMQATGPGLSGIAAGLTTGAKRYAEESRLTEAARQKIEEARDAHDDLKYNRDEMSRKQILAAQGKIAEAKVAVRKDTIDYLAKEKDVSTKVAGHIFDAQAARLAEAQKQQFQAGENKLNRAAQLSAAGIGASAPSAQMQMAATLGGGNVEAGLRKMTEIAAGKFNIQDAYANYLKSMGPGGMGLSPQEFAAQIRALTPQIRP